VVWSVEVSRLYLVTGEDSNFMYIDGIEIEKCEIYKWLKMVGANTVKW